MSDEISRVTRFSAKDIASPRKIIPQEQKPKVQKFDGDRLQPLRYLSELEPNVSVELRQMLSHKTPRQNEDSESDSIQKFQISDDTQPIVPNSSEEIGQPQREESNETQQIEILDDDESIELSKDNVLDETESIILMEREISSLEEKIKIKDDNVHLQSLRKDILQDTLDDLELPQLKLQMNELEPYKKSIGIQFDQLRQQLDQLHTNFDFDIDPVIKKIDITINKVINKQGSLVGKLLKPFNRVQILGFNRLSGEELYSEMSKLREKIVNIQQLTKLITEINAEIVVEEEGVVQIQQEVNRKKGIYNHKIRVINNARQKLGMPTIDVQFDDLSDAIKSNDSTESSL